MKVSADYKEIALDVLDGKWRVAILTGLVASLICGGSISSGGDSSLSSILENIDGSESLQFQTFIIFAVLILIAFAIAKLIISGAAQLGYAKFNLKLVDKEDVSFSDLFSQFHRIGDGFRMNLLMGVYIFLWSMLFTIPGIIKSYSYAMTPYILAENPGMFVNDAITESRRIMNGNKWRLFCLDFSFIGWQLLCSAPLVIVATIVLKSLANGGSLLVVLWLIPCCIFTIIVSLFLNPYIEAARAAFYRDITYDPNADASTQDGSAIDNILNNKE